MHNIPSTGFGGRFSRFVMVSRSVGGSRDMSELLAFVSDDRMASVCIRVLKETPLGALCDFLLPSVQRLSYIQDFT